EIVVTREAAPYQQEQEQQQDLYLHELEVLLDPPEHQTQRHHDEHGRQRHALLCAEEQVQRCKQQRQGQKTPSPVRGPGIQVGQGFHHQKKRRRVVRAAYWPELEMKVVRVRRQVSLIRIDVITDRPCTDIEGTEIELNVGRALHVDDPEDA